MENYKTARTYIETVYGTKTFSRSIEVKDSESLMDLMDDFSNYNITASIPNFEVINYKGRGEHSVRELENIAELYIELCRELNKLK